MSRRLFVFIAALVGAALAAGGALTGLEPFESAQAVSPPAGSLEHEQEDALREILRESEPGARVTMKEGGGFSVVGKLNAEAAAEATRAEDLAEAGPYTLRCDGGAEALRCAPVPDAEVVPALRRGDQALYGRTVHFGIPWAAIENRIPLPRERRSRVRGSGKRRNDALRAGGRREADHAGRRDDVRILRTTASDLRRGAHDRTGVQEANRPVGAGTRLAVGIVGRAASITKRRRLPAPRLRHSFGASWRQCRGVPANAAVPVCSGHCQRPAKRHQ